MSKHVVQRRYFNCQFITSNLEFFLKSMEGKEYHQNQLAKHCRVCGKAVKGYAHSVNKDHRNLLAVAGIDTNQDSKEVHPNSFCNGCYLTLQQMQAAALSGNVRETALRLFQWVPHQDGCPICKHFVSSERGGRPRKQKNPRGRPKDGKRALHQHILTISTPSYMVDSKFEMSRFSAGSVPLAHLQCRLCQHIVDQPIETYHHHLMCATCLRGCINDDSWCCPCGDPSHHLSVESLQKPSEVVLKLHATLLITARDAMQKWNCSTCVHMSFLRVKMSNHPHLPKLQYGSFGKVRQLPLQHPWRCKQLAF